MLLTINILCSELKNHYEFEILGFVKSGFVLIEPKLYDPTVKCEDNCVYVLPSWLMLSDPQLPPKGALFICVGGAPPAMYYSMSNAAIVLKRAVGEEKRPIYDTATIVYSVLQGIFRKYDIWDDGLSRSILKANSLQDLLDLSRDIIGSPMLVLNSDFQTDSHTLDFKKYAFLRPIIAEDNRSLKLAATDLFDYRTIPNLLNKLPIVTRTGDASSCSIDLYNGDNFLGCLIAMKDGTDFIPSDCDLLMHLARSIEFLNLYSASAFDRNQNELCEILKLLLSGESISKELSTRLSSYVDGLRNREFICFFIALKEGMPISHSAILRKQIKVSLGEVLILDYKDGLLIFHKLPMNVPVLWEYLKPFRNILRSSDYKAGASRVFTDFTQVPGYSVQAQSALKIGMILEPQYDLYIYDDYAFEHLLLNIPDILTAELLCAPKVLKLYQMRQQGHNSELYHTLREYFENKQNAALTAKCLNIHRSTLLKRLDRIYEILGSNLTDYIEMLYIQSSMYLLELVDKIKGNPLSDNREK